MSYQKFNSQDLMSNFEGDEDILKDLINEFVLKVDGLIGNIEKSINDKNYAALKLSAHTLKGVVSNFYAEEVRLLCHQLEQNGDQAINGDNLVLLENLKKQMKELVVELENLKQTL